MSNSTNAVEYEAMSAIHLGHEMGRRHPQRQVERIMRSIEKFGIVRPLIVDSDGRFSMEWPSFSH
jgi:ParB-like chromosome segregation protein Spo0J